MIHICLGNLAVLVGTAGSYESRALAVDTAKFLKKTGEANFTANRTKARNTDL